MLKINRVGALDGNCLDIELSNGNLLLLSLQPVMQYPEFKELLEDNRILYPKTDGNSVFWKNGPSISIENLIKLMQAI